MRPGQPNFFKNIVKADLVINQSFSTYPRTCSLASDIGFCYPTWDRTPSIQPTRLAHGTFIPKTCNLYEIVPPVWRLTQTLRNVWWPWHPGSNNFCNIGGTSRFSSTDLLIVSILCEGKKVRKIEGSHSTIRKLEYLQPWVCLWKMILRLSTFLRPQCHRHLQVPSNIELDLLQAKLTLYVNHLPLKE